MKPMENGKALFGHRLFCLATIEDNKIVEITEHTPPKHEPGVYPRGLLPDTDVIAAGMGESHQFIR